MAIPKTKPISIAQIASLFALIGSIFAITQSLAVIPYRIEKIEYEVKAVKTERDTDHEILIRVDEQVRIIHKQLEDNYIWKPK